jgi:hypothetical protein
MLAASLAVVLAIAVLLWFRTQEAAPPAAPAAADAPRQFDTTGGQELRPRWDNGGEQSNDAADN